MQKTSLYAVALLAALTSAGCSTITQSESQSLALTAAHEGNNLTPNGLRHGG